MRFPTLIAIVSSFSLGLAHNKTSHFWNTTTVQPNPTSSGFVSTTNSSQNGPALGGKYLNNTVTTTTQPSSTPFDIPQITNNSSPEVMAMIQIQIGDLFGSGIINLSNISDLTSLDGFNNLLSPSSMSSVPYQTGNPSAPCQNFSLPNTTASPLEPSPATLDSSTTASTSQPSPAALGFNLTGPQSTSPRSTSSPSDFALFTSSGVPINRGLPDVSLLLTAVVALML